jgi:hypothetical protein
VVVVDENSETLAWICRALSRRFELVTFDSVVGGLIGLAAINPEVLVLGDVSPLDVGSTARCINASTATRHVRIVTLGAEAKGASAWVSRSDVAGLREAMEQVTGVQ